MAAERAFARWVHPNEHALSDGTVLVPGETIVEIPAAELDSSHWEKVSRKEADKQADVVNTVPGAGE